MLPACILYLPRRLCLQVLCIISENHAEARERIKLTKGECTREKLVFGGVDGVVEEQENDGEVDADFDKDVEDT